MQALSLCVKKGLNEQRFFSQLNNVRQSNKPSTQQQQQQVAAPKRKNKKKRNRNVAVRQAQRNGNVSFDKLSFSSYMMDGFNLQIWSNSSVAIVG